MPDSTYGGTIPPTTTPSVPTTAEVPVTPATPDTGLAFTGGDLLGTLAIGAALVAAGIAAVWHAHRTEDRREDLLIAGYGGTAYGSDEDAA